MVDEDPIPGKFILTGSQQFGLLAGVPQSLAGRVGMTSLLPLSLSELPAAQQSSLSLDTLIMQVLRNHFRCFFYTKNSDFICFHEVATL